MVIAQLTMLLLVLLRETLNPTAVRLQGTNTVHSENEIIRHAQQYISAHIREKLSVRLIAQEVDVSPSYLTVLFQKNLQISPGEYIRRNPKLQEEQANDPGKQSEFYGDRRRPAILHRSPLLTAVQREVRHHAYGVRPVCPISQPPRSGIERGGFFA